MENNLENQCAECLEYILHQWGHGFTKQVDFIIENVNIARKKLQQNPADMAGVLINLARIETLASKLVELKSPYHFEMVDLNVLYQDFWKDWKQNRYSTQIELIEQLSSDPVLVWANASWLKKVLDSLVDNATKALIDQKENQEKKIWIQTLLEDGYGILVVKDNGPGIDEFTRKSLFDHPINLQPNGHGRGLYIARLLVVEIYQGSIEEDLQYSPGAAFVIRIPVKTSG